ncbi:MAG: hypothetical protein ACOYOV_04830, partial [Bacteroidales bacterium]
LNDFMMANYNQCSARPMEGMIWWAMILSNLSSGMLLSLIFSWINTKGVISGLKHGGIIGLLIAVSMDFSLYSMSTTFQNITAVFVDIITYSFMMAIAGAMIAWVMGLVKEKA